MKRLREVCCCSRLSCRLRVRQYALAARTGDNEWKGKGMYYSFLLEKAEKRLGIEKPDDWNSVLLTDLKGLGFPSNLSRIKLTEMLRERYPDRNWEKVLLLRGKYSYQKRLERAVAHLFPDQEILTNARKEAKILNPTTGAFLELDIYIPSLNLAFECQERHHYVDTHGAVTKLVQEGDIKKKDLAVAKGITLIVVPCWWDGKLESLVATIKKSRSDVLPNVTIDETEPISEDIPPGYFDKHKTQIEDIGEPTNACFFTIAPSDPSKWWMFEKYDGIRGFWNPKKKAFYSRNGNVLSAFPKEIIDAMPQDTFLDGELWFGRGALQESMKIVHSLPIDWTQFRYKVFDIPTHKGTYAERYAVIEDVISKLVADGKAKFIEVAEKVECRDVAHLEEYFQDIIDKGGEGVILRDPSAPFQPGRSSSYLKHKKYRDAEAKVVRKVSEFLWECELPNGVRFTATPGTTEFMKRWNPQPGDIVSFKHHGFLLSSKKPKAPSLYRLRSDIQWQDVVKNWKEKVYTPRAPPLRLRSIKGPDYYKRPDVLRPFFDKFAEERKINPLDPHSWYGIASLNTELAGRKGGAAILRAMKSFREAIQAAYPEVPFLRWKKYLNNLHGLEPRISPNTTT